MKKRNAKPFPWGCSHCGTRTVVAAAEDYAAEICHDGKAYDICVPNALVPKCSECGRKVLTNSLSQQVYDALREKLGILTPAQIRANIGLLGLSQKDVASRIGVAPETLSRWITGAMIQTRANDRLLRLFFHLPAAREILQDPFDPAVGISAVSYPVLVAPDGLSNGGLDLSRPINRIGSYFEKAPFPDDIMKRKLGFELVPMVLRR